MAHWVVERPLAVNLTKLVGALGNHDPLGCVEFTGTVVFVVFEYALVLDNFCACVVFFAVAVFDAVLQAASE